MDVIIALVFIYFIVWIGWIAVTSVYCMDVYYVESFKPHKEADKEFRQKSQYWARWGLVWPIILPFFVLGWTVYAMKHLAINLYEFFKWLILPIK